MAKIELWNQLQSCLQTELEQAERAARDAADYATNDEAKAKSKYDTQGLEASYLAAGQAKKVGELRDALAKIHSLRPEMENTHIAVREGSYITLLNGIETDHYFIVPAGGGETLKTDASDEVWTLTPQSPLGRMLIGKLTGSPISMPNGAQASINSVE